MPNNKEVIQKSKVKWKKNEPSDNERISAAFSTTIGMQFVWSFIFNKHWILLLSGLRNFKQM